MSHVVPQQSCPVPPQGVHVRFAQTEPDPQVLLAQHGWFAPPQVRQLPESQIRLALLHVLPAQQGWVAPPHALHMLPAQTSPALVHCVPQHP